ncbi:hypothetical protein, partial [Streptosporangium sp. NPDC000509]|uniref:hypothetical protein n=1 Tax=Streptosporangium sp. NPDC000509 TaxID=3366186 RepID=UPI003698DF4B
LAFNTLLSSQETDAYTITLTRPTGPAELRGVRFILFFRCAFILSGPLFRVKPTRSGLPVSEFTAPPSQGDPPNVLDGLIHVESNPFRGQRSHQG